VGEVDDWVILVTSRHVFQKFGRKLGVALPVALLQVGKWEAFTDAAFVQFIGELSERLAGA
jgi:hypothetical protein